MEKFDFQKNIFLSYMRLRRGLAILAFLFPVGLLIIGLIQGVPLLGSMSEYYFAITPPNSDIRAFPMRGWFVGILWAVGSYLYLYKGFSRTENIFLNGAGICAILVALIPMKVPEYCAPNCGASGIAFLHGAAAITLFLCMAVVAWACSDETLVQLDKAKRDMLRRLYSALAVLMILAPATAVALTYALGQGDKRIFAAEFAGIWTFAAYWALKSWELDHWNSERLTMNKTTPFAQDSLPEAESGLDGLRKRLGRLFD